jgi:hypothetical protein
MIVTIETEDELFEALLNELDITYQDEGIRARMKDAQKRADAYLADKYGGQIDYAQDMQARELLFSYCRYARSNAINEFENDFLSQITSLSIRGAIYDTTWSDMNQTSISDDEPIAPDVGDVWLEII